MDWPNLTKALLFSVGAAGLFSVFFVAPILLLLLTNLKRNWRQVGRDNAFIYYEHTKKRKRIASKLSNPVPNKDFLDFKTDTL